ncbi:NADAR family protein [Cereibacter sphaeroides]|uniref:NADAR family protein n=1 Tax=Cereibacter sphaeroides TaxID=1063 RepID=UPI001F3AD75A|nr:NADAR family protein [Cereibacter sphaeroides]MCE6958727.1 NADAR family protein [Cereibacter sphaeroides]MCE6973399.1 NADAR family protein [Cereibacter sphaeroides]
MANPGIRIYQPAEAAVFRRTADEHGGFSNMAGGWPIEVAGQTVRSTEALYQALRFPDHPEVQRAILDEKSPMFAKRKAYETIGLTRADWQVVNIPIMKFGLRVKVSQHRERALELLAGARGRPIVELSMRDAFWGAVPQPDGSLKGANVLGRLWMEIEARLVEEPDAWLHGVEAPDVPALKLLGRDIGFTPVPQRVQAAPAQVAFDL